MDSSVGLPRAVSHTVLCTATPPLGPLPLIRVHIVIVIVDVLRPRSQSLVLSMFAVTLRLRFSDAFLVACWTLMAHLSHILKSYIFTELWQVLDVLHAVYNKFLWQWTYIEHFVRAAAFGRKQRNTLLFGLYAGLSLVPARQEVSGDALGEPADKLAGPALSRQLHKLQILNSSQEDVEVCMECVGVVTRVEEEFRNGGNLPVCFSGYGPASLKL